MTIFYIKMKIRAGGGSFRAGGGSFRAAGCSPLLFLFVGNTIQWADIYRGTHCYSGQILIGGHIVTVQIFIGGHIVMVGRYLFGDTLL